MRVVTILEKKYPNFDGLNLTYETLEGLVKHNGPFLDLNKIPQTVKLSTNASSSMEEIRKFLFNKMYRNELVVKKLDKNALMIEKLFLLFIKDIHKLPEQWKYFNGQILSELSQKEKFRVIADYIAGMTDNYLKREYNKFYK